MTRRIGCAFDTPGCETLDRHQTAAGRAVEALLRGENCGSKL
jgi:hypothetical protein